MKASMVVFLALSFRRMKKASRYSRYSFSDKIEQALYVWPVRVGLHFNQFKFEAAPDVFGEDAYPLWINFLPRIDIFIKAD